MSIDYTHYIMQHKDNVKKGYEWLKEKEIIKDSNFLKDLINKHDMSKYTNEEYGAYDDYFYGKKKSDISDETKKKIDEAFDFAWLNHIHHNPHHWQYWLLKEDDNQGFKALEMPYDYVVEMICDWWSFSWKLNKLEEIFNWYDSHKNIVLNPNTKKLVESILENIKKELQKE